ncbi:HAD domain-containing protein [Kribbella sp. WER1]
MRISGRPIVYLDVDGTLLPFGDNPAVGRLVADVGPRLAALPCELVWATTWGDDANTEIGPRLGLPRLAVVSWESDPEPQDHRSGLHWKTRGLAAWAGDRPFAWLDDELTTRDAEWLDHHHPAPTLLERLDPRQGVTSQTLTVLESWLANL